MAWQGKIFKFILSLVQDGPTRSTSHAQKLIYELRHKARSRRDIGHIVWNLSSLREKKCLQRNAKILPMRLLKGILVCFRRTGPCKSASLDALVSAWFLEMTYELISQRRCRDAANRPSAASKRSELGSSTVDPEP